MTITLTSEQFEVLRRDQLRANPPEVMTSEEAGLYLGLHPETVRSWAAEGRIPSVRKGGSLRFSLAALRGWMEESNDIDGRRTR
jgi:excisionase family DNA binding protein